MSDDNKEILIMEVEGRVLNAEAAKKAIQLRIAKRERDNKADREHIALQDKIIADCQAKVKELKGGA